MEAVISASIGLEGCEFSFILGVERKWGHKR
jgi:hypothetical protein